MDTISDPLPESLTVNSLLFWCTFPPPGSDQLERYYSRYAITSEGSIVGSLLPKNHRLYHTYRTVSEFADIARDLILLQKFDEFALNVVRCFSGRSNCSAG